MQKKFCIFFKVSSLSSLCLPPEHLWPSEEELGSLVHAALLSEVYKVSYPPFKTFSREEVKREEKGRRGEREDNKGKRELGRKTYIVHFCIFFRFRMEIILITMECYTPLPIIFPKMVPFNVPYCLSFSTARLKYFLLISNKVL